MAKKQGAKSKRDELLAALQTAEKQAAGLRDLLGLPQREWIVTTQSQLAAFFGVSTHTIDAWRRTAPVALPGERGQYDLKACFEWWLIHGPGRRGKGRPPKGEAGDEYDPLMDVQDDTPALERWRLARARDAELSLAERQKQIVSGELFQRMTGKRDGRRMGGSRRAVHPRGGKCYWAAPQRRRSGRICGSYLACWFRNCRLR
jgi:phage terminase Nu1 subunit (DNA packaging protein)